MEESRVRLEPMFEKDEIVGISRHSSAIFNYGFALLPRKNIVGKILDIMPAYDFRLNCETSAYMIRISHRNSIRVNERDLYKLTKSIRTRSSIFDEFIMRNIAEPFIYAERFRDLVERKVPSGLEQQLQNVNKDIVDSLLYSVPTFYMKKEEMNAMFGVPKFEYKKIIFSGPCTIVLWMDGTKTMARASEKEMFDPEKGVAICFMKRALGETEGKKVLRKASKDHYDEISRIASKELDEELKRVKIPLPEGVTIRPFDFNIDTSTIVEVAKVEEEQKEKEEKKVEEKEFRSCFTCKYSGKPATCKPCDVCVTNSRYEKGVRNDKA